MGGLLFDRDKAVLNPESMQPTFLLMSRAGIHANKGFSNVSPFLIQKSIDAVGGKIVDCRKLRNGQLLIQCSNGKQANKIIKMLSLSNDIFVNVEEHRSLNFSKGIFYTNELRELKDEEVKEEIAAINKNVVEIKRLKKRDPETRKLTNIDSGLYIATFNVRKAPDHIFVGYFYTGVRPYIPNPLRCFNCFKFGHISDKCSSQVKICPHCSNTEHTSVDESGKRERCDNQPKCINCQKDHNSFSKECAAYKKEYAIQSIRITQNKSMYEARKEYEKQNPLPSTYANAVTTMQSTPTTKQCNCLCKCQQSGEKQNLTTTEKTSPVKTLRETLSSVSSMREVRRTDGSKITIIPKNISKRKKREITNAEKKKKQNTNKDLDTAADDILEDDFMSSGSSAYE